jgi:magnesium transporter
MKLKIPNKINRKNKIKEKIGKPPGTLIYTGEKKSEVTTITIVEYSDTDYTQRKVESIEELTGILSDRKKDKIYWLDINGLHNVELLSKLGEYLGIHNLVMEDVLNLYQRPKVDYFSDDIFLILKRINSNSEQEFNFEQVSMLLRENFVITFQDDPNTNLNVIQSRIEASKSLLRKAAADFLFYVIADYLIDQYFLVLEELNDKVENLQDDLVEKPSKDDISRIQNLKKDLQKIRQSISPVREIMNSLMRQDSDLILDSTIIYLRDSLDHLIQLLDMIETYRDSITTLLDIYLSSVSNRMNEVMKVLTIIATIFIPLTFIAGVYGMNFEYMPELHWRYGYFIILGLMLLVGILLGTYFKKKNWL